LGDGQRGRALSKPDATAKATLEVELDGAAPEGSLTAPDGIRRAFSGWTELAAAIEDWWHSAAESGVAERREGEERMRGSDRSGELRGER
jgi:hypothetical protein